MSLRRVPGCEMTSMTVKTTCGCMVRRSSCLLNESTSPIARRSHGITKTDIGDRMSNPIDLLQAELRSFARERDWDQYHTPQNLAALISSEAGELLALFRWGQDSVREQPTQVSEELADVFL